MYECCRRVVGRLENLYPELVADVSDFVKVIILIFVQDLFLSIAFSFVENFVSAI